MSAPRYRFTCHWELDAPARTVFEVLYRVADYPKWWPEFKDVHSTGLSSHEMSLESYMRYTLTYTLLNKVIDPPQYDEASTAEDWGEALLSREVVVVPSPPRRGRLWNPPLYPRDAAYDIPDALKERWDRERPGWRDAHRRLRARPT